MQRPENFGGAFSSAEVEDRWQACCFEGALYLALSDRLPDDDEKAFIAVCEEAAGRLARHYGLKFMVEER